MHFHMSTLEHNRRGYVSTHADAGAAREAYAEALDDLAPHGFVMVECATTPSGRTTTARLYRTLDGAGVTLSRYACDGDECAPLAVAS